MEERMKEDDQEIKKLVDRVRSTGYERPNVEFVNPEIRTVSYAAPALFGRFVFNLDKAVEAYDRGEFIRGADAVLDKESVGTAIEAVLMWRASESWYRLTAKEREAYWANIANTMKESLREGARQTGLFHARTSSRWDFVSTWRHDGPRSLELQIQRLRELDFFRYFEVEVISGLAIDPPKSKS
jgi:hypothetical protein